MKKNSRKLQTPTRHSVMNKKNRNMMHNALATGHKANIIQIKGHRDMETMSVHLETDTLLLTQIKATSTEVSRNNIIEKHAITYSGNNRKCMSNGNRRQSREWQKISVKDRDTSRIGLMGTRFSRKSRNRCMRVTLLPL